MRFLIAAVIFTLCTGSVLAWETQKGPDWVITTQVDDGLTLTLSCRRGQGDHLDFNLAGQDFSGISSVMLWVEYPDGRLGRRPIDVVPEGSSISGRFHVSDIVLEEFRNARSLEIDVPLQQGRDLMTTDMKGSGAARLAILERCGL